MDERWTAAHVGCLLLAVLGLLTGMLSGGMSPASLLAAGLVAAALLWLLAAVVPVDLARMRCRAAAMRRRARASAFIPQRDPDAAGRPRPRAPGAGLTAA